MNEVSSGPATYKIGPFSLDLKQRVLFRGGNVVPLSPKVFDTLAVLAAEPARVVAKSELIAAVWPDTFVDENNLNQNISALRKALGDEVTIETVPRRGYRLLVLDPVTKSDAAPNAIAAVSAVERSHRSHHWPRWWLLTAGLAALASIVLIAKWYADSRNSDRRSVDSLIVLPFVNLSPSLANEYFADGLTEELTADLARIQGLRVVARTTAFEFQRKPQDIRKIGQQLKVAAVLEGSVRWQGSLVKITAQLNGTANGYHLWSHIYEGDARDVFHIQEQVAQQIADALNRQLRQSDLPRPGTENLEARNLYLEGLHLRNTTEPKRIGQAILKFQRASQLDRDYAAPQAGLAVCYVMLAWGGVMPPQEAYRLAEAAAKEALKRDDNLSTAHTSKGIVELVFEWDWPKAAQEFQRALDLNPSDAEAHHWYSHYLVVANRIDASLRESRRALDLDPLNFLISAHLGWHYLQARQFEAAVEASKKTLALFPHTSLALEQMAMAYEHLDDLQNAVASLRQVDDLQQEGIFRIDALVEGSHGRNWPANYWRVRLEWERQKSLPDDYRIATCLARLGDKAGVLDALERAYAKRNPSLIYIRHDSYFDFLEKEPRYKRLIESLRLN